MPGLLEQTGGYGKLGLVGLFVFLVVVLEVFAPRDG
jgi:hypothetical protein